MKIKKLLTPLLLAVCLLAIPVLLTGCEIGDGGSTTEPYIKKHMQSNVVNNSASIQATIVNPTDSDWEIVIATHGQWTYRGGRSWSGTGRTPIRLAPKQTINNKLLSTGSNLGENGQLDKFTYTVEIEQMEQAEPGVWGSIFAVDFENPLPSPKDMFDDMKWKGFSMNYSYDSIMGAAARYGFPEYFHIRASIHGYNGFEGARRTLGDNVENYELAYFVTSSAAVQHYPQMIAYAEANGYEYTRPNEGNIVVLRKL